MMQEAEAGQLLGNIFEQMNPGKEMKAGREKYAKLKVQGAERRLPCAGDLSKKTRQVLDKRASFLEEEPGRMLLLMGGGFGQRNLTLVELLFEEKALTLRAWAKEGLIPQRTAQGVVKEVQEALGL